MSTLTKPEREIILVIADDEQSWHVHTDSLRAVSTRLRKIAAAWGVTLVRTGQGYEFDLPLRAVRFGGPKQKRGPMSDVHKARFLAGRQKPILAVQTHTGEGPETPGQRGTV